MQVLENGKKTKKKQLKKWKKQKSHKTWDTEKGKCIWKIEEIFNSTLEKLYKRDDFHLIAV